MSKMRVAPDNTGAKKRRKDKGQVPQMRTVWSPEFADALRQLGRSQGVHRKMEGREVTDDDNEVDWILEDTEDFIGSDTDDEYELQVGRVRMKLSTIDIVAISFIILCFVMVSITLDLLYMIPGFIVLAVWALWGR